ncbi:MAG: hydantoinase/oxoprolinase family protein [Rhodospirillales bacterium]|jgi:N-methylhydantoinase A|nr:5-oxoprolinase [Rhodospirillaceae bacterium]MDP6426786.1 hydantoinase/oxoprolinase family protein [Rhodospirillales bacterium]MDP6646472.1 hydantoinase/oxoprolinase family protein [Rhodospirillales bacterium]
MAHIVGVDTGGTYTDLVALDARQGKLVYSKTLTNSADLADSALECISGAGIEPADIDLVRHGTTHVINMFVQRAGAPTALITTRGFRDLLEITRGNRPLAFQLHFRKQPPLVASDLRFEVSERIDAKGAVVQPLVLSELAPIADRLRKLDIRALAISFLNAYLNPRHEEMARDWLRQNLPGVYVSTGTDLSREWFEYERTSTAVANAYVGPKMQRYIQGFSDGLSGAGCSGGIHMMASNGGVLSVAQAKAEPIALVESGPIGGCIGAGAFAEALGLERIVAFDMGGTTAKCALIEKARFEVQPTYYIGGYVRGFPVRTAVLEISEVGAGGGSIASVSGQKRLLVGPQSAGSEPGPAAFGRGGSEPTVTDANLLLGRIGSDTFLGGAMRLDRAAARRAVYERVAKPLGYSGSELDIATVADGILGLAAMTMSTGIKEVTIERGRDPRDFALFAFGGGGPLQAAKLARELHIPLVVVPSRPGNFSAMGMLLAAARIDHNRTFFRALGDPAIAESDAVFGDMEQAACDVLKKEFGAGQVLFERHLEMRYTGQKHPVRLPFDGRLDAAGLRTAFDDFYRQQYGHANPQNAVELVGLRVTCTALTEPPDIHGLGTIEPVESTTGPRTRPVYFGELGAYVATPIHRRDELAPGFSGAGPAIIEEYGSTTVIGPDDHFAIGELSEIRIHCAATGR